MKASGGLKAEWDGERFYFILYVFLIEPGWSSLWRSTADGLINLDASSSSYNSSSAAAAALRHAEQNVWGSESESELPLDDFHNKSTKQPTNQKLNLTMFLMFAGVLPP